MQKYLQATVFTAFFVLGCPAPDPEESQAECAVAADCGETLVAPCAGCLELATRTCRLGVCQDSETAEVDLSVDVMLERGDMTTQTASLVYAIALPEGGSEPHTCDSIFASPESLAVDINVVASGYKSVSGGSFHDDIAMGRLPPASLLVVMWGTTEVGGQGFWTGRGCLSLDLTEQRDEDPILSLK